MPPRFTRAGKVVRTVSTRCPARCMPACAGKVVRTVSTRCPARCIPACTGESRAHRVDAVSCSVHPRVCGGKSCAPCRPGVLLGASPRMRGKVVRTVWTRCPARYTPALAGNTTSASIPRSCSVHPRTRGEHNSSEHPMILLGSPPRVRGVQQLRSNPHRTRSTPALAGNPASASNPSSCSVHPRSARGNSATASMPASCSVHSRSARGILHQRAIHHPARSTPAACGESQVRSSFHNHFLNRAPCGRSDDKLSLLRAYGGMESRATRALCPLRRTCALAGNSTFDHRPVIELQG